MFFKSKLTQSLFDEFTSSYQSYQTEKKPGTPFVYVGDNGTVKLVTDVISDDSEADGIFAVSVAEDGWVEFLALNDA